MSSSCRRVQTSQAKRDPVLAKAAEMLGVKSIRRKPACSSRRSGGISATKKHKKHKGFCEHAWALCASLWLMTCSPKQSCAAPSASFACGLTSVDLGAPVLELALQQHEAYCRALEDCGLSLTRLDPDDRYPDSTFVEDAAVLTERGAVITRPGAATRVGEAEAIEHVLREHFPQLRAIHEPGTLDGGDVCEGRGHFFIGISRRTNAAGASSSPRTSPTLVTLRL